MPYCTVPVHNPSDWNYGLPSRPRRASRAAMQTAAEKPSPPESLFVRQRRQLVATLVLILLSAFLPGGLLPRRVHNYLPNQSEVLDVFSAKRPGKLLPGGPRSIDDIHTAGLHHRGSVVFAVDDAHRVLLLWRAHAAVTCPSSWSLVGEHVLTRESFVEAAVRGVADEVPFLGEVETRALGKAALVKNAFRTRLGPRTDRQWTRFFVATSSFFSVDFSQILRGVPAVADPVAAGKGDVEVRVVENVENTRMLGMKIVEVVRLAVSSNSFLCDKTQRMWLLRAISVLGLVLKEEHKDVGEMWQAFKRDGSPVFCNHSESGKSAANIDLRQCGIPFGERGRDVQIVKS